MQKDTEIPVLTDLIEKGIEISMSDLGLGEDQYIGIDDPIIDATEIDINLPEAGPADPFTDNPALEQTVRRILDEHMELAWQEIRLAIQQAMEK